MSLVKLAIVSVLIGIAIGCVLLFLIFNKAARDVIARHMW